MFLRARGPVPAVRGSTPATRSSPVSGPTDVAPGRSLPGDLRPRPTVQGRPDPGVRGGHGRGAIPVGPLRRQRGRRPVHDGRRLLQRPAGAGRDAPPGRRRRRHPPGQARPAGPGPAAPAHRRGADVAVVVGPDPNRARQAVAAFRADAGQERADAARRPAGHQHGVGRRRRPPTRAHGRRRPTQGDGGVHPGHQPGGTSRVRASSSPSTTGPGPGTCRTTSASSTTTPPSTARSRRCR